MKIATWNIGGGFISENSDLKFDLEDINYFIDELRKIGPEVICLQEAHVSKNNNQPEIIARALGLKYTKTESIAQSHLKPEEKLSISIISKYPVVSSQFNKLTNPHLQFIWRGEKAFSHDKGFLEAILDYQGKKMRILCGHMVPFRKFGRDFMEDDFKKIRQEMEEIICRGQNPEIVCGDMNFEDVHILLPGVFTKGFVFVLDDEPTSPKGRRYDKIILSKEWTTVAAKIVPGKADHYLCFADTELN